MTKRPLTDNPQRAFPKGTLIRAHFREGLLLILGWERLPSEVVFESKPEPVWQFTFYSLQRQKISTARVSKYDIGMFERFCVPDS